MRKFSNEELKEIIVNHLHWIKEDCEGWENMRANLSEADLSEANLSEADLSGANLRYANLSEANLSEADLSGADLSGANLSEADLSGANLRYANLRYANLRYANLSEANLRYANLSGAKELLSSIDYLKEHFEFTSNGIIAYKTFNGSYNPPKKWVIQSGSVITETSTLTVQTSVDVVLM